MKKVFPMKKTKIVATIGPATADQKILEQLITSGMNVARINMSHGDHAVHTKTIAAIRAAEKKTKSHIAILIDLSGPKIRTGNFSTETITLKPGARVTLTTRQLLGTKEKFSISYKKLPQEVTKKSTIMIHDGVIQLRVLDTTKTEITCQVIIGGTIKGRRGVNIINGSLSISSLTKKDRDDLDWALAHDIDLVALSFVRTVHDIVMLKKILSRKSLKNLPEIISKIETAEAIEHISDIIQVSDGIMIARGDLSVETPKELVPIYQKQIINIAQQHGKYSIVATQMMESMIHRPTPTRAEISDVANAIFDGADAIMLSEETSLGNYPIATVMVMRDIALSVEDSFSKKPSITYDTTFRVSHAIAHSAERLAYKLSARMIIALTESGRTAREIAQFHGNQPIIAITPDIHAARKLAIVRGITSHIEKLDASVIELRKKITTIAKIHSGKRGDIIVIASGHKMNKSGSTNTVMVETI